MRSPPRGGRHAARQLTESCRRRQSLICVSLRQLRDPDGEAFVGLVVGDSWLPFRSILWECGELRGGLTMSRLPKNVQVRRVRVHIDLRGCRHLCQSQLASYISGSHLKSSTLTDNSRGARVRTGSNRHGTPLTAVRALHRSQETTTA